MLVLKDIIFWAMYFVSFYMSVFIILTLFERKIRKNPLHLGSLPYVSVLVPAYNEGESIARTLDSLLALSYPKDKLEIVVINDGSTDSTKKIVEDRYTKQGVVLINQKNKGKAAAMNNGIKRAKGELVACLDADSFVQKDTMKKMVGFFADSSVAAVTPILKVSNPQTLLQKAQWLEYVLYTFLKMILASIQCLNVTPGPFSIYRKQHVINVGGFDEASIVEDQEIACRLQMHHFKIMQSIDGNVLTIAPRTFKELYVQRRRWYKGTVINLYKYRKMLFNRKYGDFGIFQMPSLLVGIIMPFVILPLFLSYTITPIVNYIRHVQLAGFDMSLDFDFNIQNFTTNYLISLDYAKLFIIVIVFLVSVWLMLLAHKSTREKLAFSSVVPLVFFFIIYYILLSFIWAGAMLEFVLGKNKKW